MDSLFWWTGAFVWASVFVAAIASAMIAYVLFLGGDDLDKPQKRPGGRIPLDMMD